MAGNIHLKRRIKSAGSISKITRAMEAVSASKMMKSQRVATSGITYTQALGEIVQRIKAHGGTDFSHPFLEKPDMTKPELTIIISSDRGLCGSFNTALLRLVEKTVEDKAKVLTLGKKAHNYTAKTDWEVIASVEKLGDFPKSSDIFALALIAIEEYTKGTVGSVQIAYQKFINTLTQRPTIEQLLPIAALEETPQMDVTKKYIFEPKPTELLPSLLTYSIQAKLYQAVLSSKAAEQSARMVAMRNASKSARDLKVGLQNVYNKEYQKAITSEILDVVTAGMAIKK